MTKRPVIKSERKAPDVVGALLVIRSKKSREQIRFERLRPFIKAIDEALALNWKWSPILALIRENGGPSLTKSEAETLYARIKEQAVGGDFGPGQDGGGSQLTNPAQQSANSGEIE